MITKTTADRVDKLKVVSGELGRKSNK